MRTVNSATSASCPAPESPLPDTAARWERADGRYYLVHLHLDLFGSLVVTLVWGGIGTRRGRVRHLPVASRAGLPGLVSERAVAESAQAGAQSGTAGQTAGPLRFRSTTIYGVYIVPVEVRPCPPSS